MLNITVYVSVGLPHNRLHSGVRVCYTTVGLSSRPPELPPKALTEPDVNLSIHPALIVQPQAIHLVASEKTRTAPAEQRPPTTDVPAADGDESA